MIDIELLYSVDCSYYSVFKIEYDRHSFDSTVLFTIACFRIVMATSSHTCIRRHTLHLLPICL